MNNSPIQGESDHLMSWAEFSPVIRPIFSEVEESRYSAIARFILPKSLGRDHRRYCRKLPTPALALDVDMSRKDLRILTRDSGCFIGG